MHLEGILSHLSEITERERDGKRVKIRTAVIPEKSGFHDNSFFNDHVNNCMRSNNMLSTI